MAKILIGNNSQRLLKELTRLTILKSLVFPCGIQSTFGHTDIVFVVLDSVPLIPIPTSLYHHIGGSHQFYPHVFLKPLTSRIPPWGDFLEYPTLSPKNKLADVGGPVSP